MTNNPTPTDIEKLFDVLVPTSKCDCAGYPSHEDWCPSVQKKIVIGTVLAKMTEKFIEENDKCSCNGMVCWKCQGGEAIDYRMSIMLKWQPLGFESSIQEIVEKSGWEDCKVCDGKSMSLPCISCGGGLDKKYPRLKSPQARELLSWLCELFISPEKA